jgi:hypothetical protein
VKLAGKGCLSTTDAVAVITMAGSDHLGHRRLLMGGMKPSIHAAALAAGYAQDRFGTGQITCAMRSWHRAIARQSGIPLALFAAGVVGIAKQDGLGTKFHRKVV